MSAMTPIPGSSAVGRLEDLPPWEAELVIATRLWLDSPEGQAAVWADFARRFGPAAGRAALRQLEGFLTVLCTQARRPFVHHGAGCGCLGSDEAVLAAILREAARGDLAESALLAGLLMPAGQAELVALRAAELGQTMQRLAGRGSLRGAASDRPAEGRLLH